MYGSRSLILSPHPDDEVVGAAAMIKRAGAAGATSFVLYLTTGVPPQDALWWWRRRDHGHLVAIRRAEATVVATALNAEIAGFCQRPSRSLQYDLPEARVEVEKAIARLGIDRLLVPAYEGGHSDHDAANGLASTFCNQVAVWEFAEYNYCGGTINPNAFPERHGSECDLLLTVEEMAHKSELLRLYASQRCNLDYVGVATESFRPIFAYDYSQPAHAGTVFYQRFHWVRFRHPRVDFTKPEEVCRAVTALRAEYTGGDTPGQRPGTKL
ncbi:MAG: PIG-L family deacetylase [Rhodospirillaceae bacterium]